MNRSYSILRNTLLLCFLLLLSSAADFTDDPIKVACVGDSITYGSGIENREVQSYPAQLGQLMGEGFEVANFGVSGATMLKKGDKPYWEQKAFTQALKFAPDIVVIKLGTNDTKPQNWKHRSEYITDYKAMIDEFRALPSRPKVVVCLPVPAFEVRWGINGEIVTQEMIPALKDMVKAEGTEMLNLYKPFKNRPELFPDKIHPNAQGAALMAEHIAKKLQKIAKKP